MLIGDIGVGLKERNLEEERKRNLTGICLALGFNVGCLSQHYPSFDLRALLLFCLQRAFLLYSFFRRYRC